MYPDQNSNPQKNQPEQPVNPTPSIPNVPQLENETPMEITIYPNNENASNQPQEVKLPEDIFSENLKMNVPQAPSMDLPPLPPIEPVKSDLNFGSEPKPEPITEITPTQIPTPIPTPNPIEKKEDFLHNPANQKLALIGGSVLGVLLVGGLAALFITTNQQPIKTNPTPVSPAVLKPLPNMNNSQATQPGIAVLSLSDYQLKVDTTYKKYQSLLSTNPISLNNGMVNIETIRYVGDEIFAISNELNDLELPDNLKVGNQKLVAEFNNLVASYDEIVKTYKTNNSLSPELKNKFNTFTKASNDKIKILIDEIKNLK